MIRIAILCEGPTESAFVKHVLCQHFLDFEASIVPIIVTTARQPGEPWHHGGSVKPNVLVNQIKTLCASYDRVTMMFDYYGFPRDWRDTIDPSAPKAQRKSQLEAVVASRVDNVRFVPNLIMHEFEGLLFSQPSAIAKTVADSDQDESRWIAGLSLEARGFNSPEDINDSRESAPSKRILKVIPTYRKTLHGPLIAECIGLPVLRDKCHYFGHWIDLIEEICRKHSSRSGSNPADVCENDD